jgi:F-type H+-transporting ATPase subunit a
MSYKIYTLFLIAILNLGLYTVNAQHHEGETQHEENVAAVSHDKEQKKEEEEFDATALINHHLSDSHEYVFEVPFVHKTFHLPIILWTKNGLTVFSSSEFKGDDHGHVVVEKNGQKFVKIHDVIAYANKVGEHTKAEDITLDQRPLDFSITKNVISMLFTFLVLFFVLMKVKKAYDTKGVPRGIAKFLEPIIVFVRDDIAKENIGPKYERYLPFLLTIFFFILFANLFGLIPFAPFGYNLTGNIVITFVLATMVFLVTNLSGNKAYWKHILWPPDVPVVIKPFIAAIELLGIFIKPFALMIRLFANIFAGHTIILTFITLIFVFKNWGVPLASGFGTVFMYVSELLVAFLQAYVFTLLAAIYIGMAVKEEAHD